jgi:hypothetical protein
MEEIDTAVEEPSGGWINPLTGYAHTASARIPDDLFPKLTEDEWKDYTRYWEDRLVLRGADVHSGRTSARVQDKYVSIYEREIWKRAFVDAELKAEAEARDREIVHVLASVFQGSVPPACASAAEALYAVEQPRNLGGRSAIIMSIERVQNKEALADHILWKRRNPGGRDSLVMHGTDKSSSNAICDKGFRARFNKNGRSFWGTGNYMTNTAEIALAYARPEGPVGPASGAGAGAGAGGVGGAGGAGGAGADSRGLSTRAGMYTRYQQHVILSRLAHGPVEVLGVKDAAVLRDDKGKIATLYTNNPDANGKFTVLCAPDDAQLLVQYSVIIVFKLHEITNWAQLPAELWAYEYKPLLLTRWRLHQVIQVMLKDAEQQQGKEAMRIIQAKLCELECDWEALRPVLHDMVRAGSAREQHRLTMPNGSRVDEELADIVVSLAPLVQRAAWIRDDSKCIFKNLSGADPRFVNVDGRVHVGLPKESKELDALEKMAETLAAVAAQNMKALAVATSAAGVPAALATAAPDVPKLRTPRVSSQQTPVRLELWANLREGDEVRIANTWRGFDRFVGMKGSISAIWKPPNFQPVEFLVKIEGVSSDDTLREILMKRPNQKGIVYQDEEQEKLGEPVLRCKSGNFSKLDFKDGAWVLPDYIGYEVGHTVVIKDSWFGLAPLLGRHGRIVDIRRVEHLEHYGKDGKDHHNSIFLLVLPDGDDKATAALLKQNKHNNNPCACFAWKRAEEAARGRPLLLCEGAHLEKVSTADAVAISEAAAVATLATLASAASAAKRPAGGAAGGAAKKQKK